MRKLILLPGIALVMMLCSSAASAEIVPPGNSAASQYTEAFPTAEGEKESSGNKQHKQTPEKVLGPDKAKKLEDQGPEGKAVADFAAETSPVATPAPTEASGDGNKHQAHKPAHKNANTETGNGKSSNGSGAGGSSSSGGPKGPGAEPSGSSGTGQVIGQATGLSSGTLGLLLPLILLGVVIWSGAYMWRNRRQRVV